MIRSSSEERDPPRQVGGDEPSQQGPHRRGDCRRRPHQRVRLLLRRALEVAVDQRLHRGQQERRTQSTDDRPEDDDRSQALSERHGQCAGGVGEQSQHIRPLPADQIAHLAADQDECGRDQRLQCDRRLDAAHRGVEILNDCGDRHVHQRRIDDQHEHRHRQQHGEPGIAGSLVRSARAGYLRDRGRPPAAIRPGVDSALLIALRSAHTCEATILPRRQGRRITPSGRARPTVQTRLRRLTPIASRLPCRPGTRRLPLPASGRSVPDRSSGSARTDRSCDGRGPSSQRRRG